MGQPLWRLSKSTIGKAHDPPPVPSPDRVPRKEVYEKAWESLEMGSLRLPEGRTGLVVRALTRPGNSVMELKAVSIQRLD